MRASRIVYVTFNANPTSRVLLVTVRFVHGHGHRRGCMHVCICMYISLVDSDNDSGSVLRYVNGRIESRNRRDDGHESPVTAERSASQVAHRSGERERKRERKKKQNGRRRAERYALRLHDSRERKREIKIRMPFIRRIVYSRSRRNGSRQ